MEERKKAVKQNKTDIKDMEQNFLSQYQAYWEEEGNLSQIADGEFCRLAELKAARLAEKEIEYREVIEQVDGAGRVQNQEEDAVSVRQEKKITKSFKRHGRMLYKKTLQRMTNLTWTEGEVSAFYMHEDFTASFKRYLYIANQLAAFPVVMLYMMLPTPINTVWYRFRDIMLCVAIVLPVMWILAGLLCLMRNGLNSYRERRAEAARIQTEKQIKEKWPQISVKEMKAAMDTQLKVIHFVTDKKELKRYGCEEPGFLLSRYADICDCSVGAVRFGMAEEGKNRIRIPAEVQIYFLKDNNKNLVPRKEQVHIVMEYRSQWRIVEYSRKKGR